MSDLSEDRLPLALSPENLVPPARHGSGAVPVRQASDRHDSEPTVIAAQRGESARAMRQRVLAAFAGKPRHLVVDLSALHALSTAHIEVLVGLRARQLARSRRLTLVVAPGSGAARGLSRNGVRSAFDTAPDLQSARNVADLPQQRGAQ